MKSQVFSLALAAMMAAGMTGQMALFPDERAPGRGGARPQYTSMPVNRSREEARRRRQAARLASIESPTPADPTPCDCFDCVTVNT